MAGKILITGANGSYGAALCKVAKEWGYEVYGTDIVDINPDLLDNKHFIKADITDPEAIKQLAELGVDAVVHTAGVIDVRKTELHQKVHVEGTSSLIDLFKKTDLKVWVTVSTAAVHGGTKEDIFITEDLPRVLKDSYTITKAKEHDLTLEKFSEKSIIIQPALVYDELNRYLFREIAQMISLQIMPALPDYGNFWVGMVHPFDLATGTLLAIERGEFGQSYIICDGKPLRLIELAKMVCEATNARLPTRNIRIDLLDRIVNMIGMLDTILPALEGMEPMASIMADMGMDLSSFQLPMDPDYMRTHHKYSSAKLMEVTKQNAKQYRVNEATLQQFPDGWKAEIDPTVEMPKVLKYWTEQDPPVIVKDAKYPDVIEFFFDMMSGML
ncbi:MAG: NAD(P)-dependent oxidoreductase [Candidatus Helarchaeota archaeon]|nr:NAD(P)-dependent oxidoreductase [Candidatus Helarchaeota archaeon]